MSTELAATYFFKLRKYERLAKDQLVQMAPDAFFVGGIGFRGYFVKNSSGVLGSHLIKLGLYLTHLPQNPPYVTIQGRISIVDASGEKKPALVLIEEKKTDYEDWANGLEIKMNCLDYKKYSFDKKGGNFTIRFDVEQSVLF